MPLAFALLDVFLIASPSSLSCLTDMQTIVSMHAGRSIHFILCAYFIPKRFYLLYGISLSVMMYSHVYTDFTLVLIPA